MDAFTFYRAGNWMYRHHIPLIPQLLQLLVLFLFNCYIPFQVKIGKGCKIGHRGIGVVINKDSIIGRNVLIRAHVTIGKKVPNGGAPKISDNVVIGDGAKIIGDIYIGDGAVIGANAVVLKDIPGNALAVGVPAKIIERNP